MEMIEIRLQDSAVWHALLTKAQLVAEIRLPEKIEDYVACLVYRSVNNPISADDIGLTEQTGTGDAHRDLLTIAEQSLILAGLTPEQAIQNQVPVSYFVDVAGRAYRELGESTGELFYLAMADRVVDCMDVLQTLREIDGAVPSVDLMSALDLWRDTGSAHAWHRIGELTSAMPHGDVSIAVH